MTSFKIVGSHIEGLSLQAMTHFLKPGQQVEIMSNDQSAEIYFICNTITGKATVSALSAELIEKAYAYNDKYIPKRGPEQVICMFSRAIGITILNFDVFPKSMIWDGVASYAKRKAQANA